MLPRRNRMRTRFEFGKVKKYGNSYRYKYFYLYALPITRLKEISQGRWDIDEETKVGFLVSKKFSKKAVVRNKVKRIFRESVRKNFDKIQKGWWVVFHPRFICIGAPYEKINAEINTALQKISVSG